MDLPVRQRDVTGQAVVCNDYVRLHPHGVRIPVDSIIGASMDLWIHVGMHVQSTKKNGETNLIFVWNLNLHIEAEARGRRRRVRVALDDIEAHRVLLKFELSDHKSTADIDAENFGFRF